MQVAVLAQVVEDKAQYVEEGRCYKHGKALGWQGMIQCYRHRKQRNSGKSIQNLIELVVLAARNCVEKNSYSGNSPYKAKDNPAWDSLNLGDCIGCIRKAHTEENKNM